MQLFHITMTVETDDIPTRISLENAIKNALDLADQDIRVVDMDVSHPE